MSLYTWSSLSIKVHTISNPRTQCLYDVRLIILCGLGDSRVFLNYHRLYITTAQQTHMYIYMHITLWDIIIYLGVCVCECECESPPLINSSLTGYISSIEFRTKYKRCSQRKRRVAI